MITKQELQELLAASQPGSDKVLITLRNSSEREDVKETSRKHYIKTTWSFETVIDPDLNIHSLEAYSEEKIIPIIPPYIKLRYSGENFIKSYPKAGREATERKIISRTREYLFWNQIKSELIPCDKKTINVVAEALVKKYIERQPFPAYIYQAQCRNGASYFYHSCYNRAQAMWVHIYSVMLMFNLTTNKMSNREMRNMSVIQKIRNILSEIEQTLIWSATQERRVV